MEPKACESVVGVELVHATLEPNTNNPDGQALTLYFDQKPTSSEVREACRGLLGRLPLGVDTSDPDFDFEVHSTPVSERAGLVRVEVYPTC